MTVKMYISIYLFAFIITTETDVYQIVGICEGIVVIIVGIKQFPND